VYGALIKSLSGNWQPGVYENWLAAAPVVALGAPLGVFVVARLGRKSTLLVVATLCVGQFFWTCFVEQHTLGFLGSLLALIAVCVLLAVFEELRTFGHYAGERLEQKANRQTPLGNKIFQPGKA